MTTIRTRLLAAGAIGLALTSVLAGCGSDKSGGSSAGTGGATAGSGSSCTMLTGATATVSIQNFAFKPTCVSVAVGTKVTFSNEDGTTHTATDAGSGGFDSSNLKQGQSYTHTFTKAGTYSYICSIHQYMRGTIVVR